MTTGVQSVKINVSVIRRCDMAKRDEERQKNQQKYRRRVIINWIICGASLAAIIILRLMSKQ